MVLLVWNENVEKPLMAMKELPVMKKLQHDQSCNLTKSKTVKQLLN
jgi:hypothetical protein